MNFLPSCMLLIALLIAGPALAEWPMKNDPAFDPTVSDPAYPLSTGPKILLDGAHHNFFIQWDFIQPFAELAKADGYRPIVDDKTFSPGYLAGFDIVVIITALPFNFTEQTEVTTEVTFTEAEIEALHDWVENGGALLVFSEHAPFDQAINKLLGAFGLESSVGYVVDPEHHDKSMGRPGWIVYSRDNGLLNVEHPIIQGRHQGEAIEKVMTFGGSSLTGEGYVNLLRLSPTARNEQHPTGVGPVGMGNSQALAGTLGKGKVVALGDSNGFTAMNFARDDGSVQSAGMNSADQDWKQWVLNVLHWLSDKLSAE